MKPKTAGCDGGQSHFASTNAPCNHLRADQTCSDSGIVWGAHVITMKGAISIQDLRPGHRIIARNAGAMTVRKVEQTSRVTRGIYIVAGSLGHGRADRDSLVPASQTVLIRDWRARICGRNNPSLVSAGDLVDGEFVRDIGLHPMTLFRVFCDKPCVLYADGLELGSGDAMAPSPRVRVAITNLTSS